MQAARRTAPIAPDFEAAIDTSKLPPPSRLIDELLTYRTKPQINPRLLPTPPPDDPYHNVVELPPSFREHQTQERYIPSSLPKLPSPHTYKATPVYPQQETDPRRIRELATEEGKLGEQALRKLAGAVKLESALANASQVARRGPPSRKTKNPMLSVEASFEQTMRELMKDSRRGFELGPLVTSEKSFRKPDNMLMHRRPANLVKSSIKEAAAAGLSAGDMAKKGERSRNHEIMEP